MSKYQERSPGTQMSKNIGHPTPQKVIFAFPFPSSVC
jgi:hypothetical protein